MALLEIENLVVEFATASGPFRAVDGVSLSVPTGALVGLIGPNGAGKTTFIDAVCGFVPAAGRSSSTGCRWMASPPTSAPVGD